MKRKILKENSGASIIFVLILLAILSVMGTSLYAYSMQSLDVMKWGFDSARAKYLARAGVEQAAYAYQSAIQQSKEANGVLNKATQFIDAAERKFIIGTDGNKLVLKTPTPDGKDYEIWEDDKPDTEKIVTTNWSFACVYEKSKDDIKYGNNPRVVYIDGGNGEQPDRSKVTDRKKVIGYFRVSITNTPKLVHMYSDCKAEHNLLNSCKDKSHYRVENYKTFDCTAYVEGKSGTQKASLLLSDFVSEENRWTDENGVMLFPAISAMNKGDIDMSGGFDPKDIKPDSRVSEMGESSFTFPKKLGYSMGSVKFKIYGGGSTGNLVLNLPSDPKNPEKKQTLKFVDFHNIDDNPHYQANSIFSGSSLFIKAGIDTEPQPLGFNTGGFDTSQYPWYIKWIADAANVVMATADRVTAVWKGKAPNVNMLYLSGNNIIIDGDIDLYAYYFNSNWFVSTWEAAMGNVRLGTVILNTPVASASSNDDPMPEREGGVPGNVGKVFFGGDVRFHMLQNDLNGGNKTYTFIKAGSVYYFSGNTTQKMGFFEGENNIELHGIDLLKFFIDTSIMNNPTAKDKYPADIIKKFTDINEAYYYMGADGDSQLSIAYYDKKYKGHTVSMRRIDPDGNSKYDKVRDIVPPSIYGNTYIVWE